MILKRNTWLFSIALVTSSSLYAATAQEGQVQSGQDDVLDQGQALPDAVNGAPDEFDELDFLSRTDDEEFPELNETVAREPVSVTVRALDKVTAKYQDLTIAMNEVVDFGTLKIAARYCDTRPPEEFPETSAFLQVFDQGFDDGAPADRHLPERGEVANAVALPEDAPVADHASIPLPDKFAPIAGKKIFSGWMFASSPALNALEHPVYDVWVISCETMPEDSE